jgi:alpha-1,2-mannosyltransferase
LWNFLKYNVLAGGESALYGVEPWTFYIRNGLLNFNLALVLAASYPVIFLLQFVGFVAIHLNWRLAVATMPLYVWTAALSSLPHKEERFLYVTYPQVLHILM